MGRGGNPPLPPQREWKVPKKKASKKSDHMMPDMHEQMHGKGSAKKPMMKGKKKMPMKG